MGRKMNFTPEEKRALLKEEYFFLQQQYTAYDDKTLTIKGWISTGSIAGLALAFGKDIRYAYLIPCFIALICGVFWYLETYWKLFQYAFSDRIRIIEAYFRNDQMILFKDPDPLQVYYWWSKSYKMNEPIYEYEKTQKNWPRPATSTMRIFRVAILKFVCLPYLVIIMLCLFSLWFL